MYNTIFTVIPTLTSFAQIDGGLFRARLMYGANCVALRVLVGDLFRDLGLLRR